MSPRLKSRPFLCRGLDFFLFRLFTGRLLPSLLCALFPIPTSPIFYHPFLAFFWVFAVRLFLSRPRPILHFPFGGAVSRIGKEKRIVAGKQTGTKYSIMEPLPSTEANP